MKMLPSIQLLQVLQNAFDEDFQKYLDVLSTTHSCSLKKLLSMELGQVNIPNNGHFSHAMAVLTESSELHN